MAPTVTRWPSGGEFIRQDCCSKDSEEVAKPQMSSLQVAPDGGGTEAPDDVEG
ncbi:MAG: hypothetical protein AAF799_06170 [Myxococcota bacterium]